MAGWLGAGKRYEGAANEGDLGRFIVDRQNAVDGQGKTGGLRQHLPNPDTATSSSDLERWRRRRREGDGDASTNAHIRLKTSFESSSAH